MSFDMIKAEYIWLDGTPGLPQQEQKCENRLFGGLMVQARTRQKVMLLIACLNLLNIFVTRYGVVDFHLMRTIV